MNANDELAQEIRKLEKKIQNLERIANSGSNITVLNDSERVSQILMRINAIQNLVDQVEIEIDKLEMRVSAIEHMGFRFRTSGQ
jgi:DNA-binding transcriptional regulator WhiA